MRHFLTFLFHRVLWNLSVIPTEHTWRAKPIPVYMSVYKIIQFDDQHFCVFHILYIKIHAQVLYNTIPSNSFVYLFNHGWHGFGDWLSLPLIGAIGIKIKILYGFCAHSTVTLYLHYVVFVFMNKKNYGYLRVTECLFADIEQLGYHLLKSVVLLQKLFQIHWKPTDHIHASKKETCIVCMVYLLLSVSLIVCVKENALIVEI